MSKVPDRATHWWTVGHYAMKSSPGFAIWQDGEWLWIGDEFEGSMLELVTKPTKPWSGPEDGLPPVGTACEVIEGPAHWGGECTEWIGVAVTVRATFTNKINQGIVAVERFGGFCDCFIVECLAPAKTPEQLAADKRETAIRELMDIAGVDCRVTAARLVDAGFKREVV